MKIPYTHSTADPEVAIVLKVGEKYKIDEAMVIYTSKIEVKDWVTLKCKYGCEKYGQSYSCPPNSIPTDTMRKVLKEYKRAILIASTTKNLEDQGRMRTALIEMEKALFLKNYYKAFALVPGCCDNCNDCSAKEEKSCTHSKDKRPCIEGTGIDVFNLVSKYKKAIHPISNKNQSFESYGIILLD